MDHHPLTRLIKIRNARARQQQTALHLRNEALIRHILSAETAPAKADHRTIYALVVLVTAIAWVVLK